MDGGPEASPRGAAALDQRLRECRAGGGRALNLGYLEGGLPADFAALVLAAAPHVAELDLSRYGAAAAVARAYTPPIYGAAVLQQCLAGV